MAAARGPCSRRAASAPACRRARRARCSGASCSAARRSRSRSTASAAASAGACRWRSSCSPGANVLILDEPTNHLDLESREALEDALQAFPGSLLLVTHDRALLDAVGSRTVAIEDHTLHSYVGGWPEYARVREERKAVGRLAVGRAGAAGEGRQRQGAAAPNGDGRATPAARAGPAPPARPRTRCARSSELERAVEEAEAALAALEDELADPKHWATKYESAKSTARHTAAKRAVEEAYAAWEEHAASLESA